MTLNMTAEFRWQIMAITMGINAILCISLATITRLAHIRHNATKITNNHHNQHVIVKRQPLLPYFMYSFGLFCALQCFLCHYSIQYPGYLSDPFCRFGSPVCVVLYYSAKASLYGFFLERARLAQGLLVIFPKWLFKYVLPFYIFIYWCLFSGFILLFFRGVIPDNINNGAVTSCILTTTQSWVLSAGAVVDICNCIGFLFLFLYPLHKANLQKKKKVITMMRLNVILSFICSSSSFITMFVLPLIAQYIWFAGNIDMIINNIAVFCMMAVNRQYISVVCCTCRTNAEPKIPNVVAHNTAAKNTRTRVRSATGDSPLHKNSNASPVDSVSVAI